MHRHNHVNSDTVVKLKLLLRLRVKHAASRFSTSGVAAIPVILIVSIRLGTVTDLRKRIVQATLSEQLPKAWLN